MYLEYNKCKILLSKSESAFLKNRLNENLSLENVKLSLLELYYNSNKRYFKIKHIKEISSKLYSKLIKEAVGRNLSDYTGLSGNNTHNNTDGMLLNFHDIVNSEVGVCTNSGKDVVTLYLNNGDVKVIYCDSPDHANLIIKNIRIKNV